jgi:ABC-2 type transport system permease protein
VKSKSTQLERATGWRLFLNTIVARAYPRVIGQQRETSWLLFDVFLPLLSVAAYVFLYRAMRAPEEYIGFVLIGGAMTAFWLNVLWSMSSQLYWEKEQGNLALYVIAPNSLMAVLLGMAMGGMLATCLRAIVILGLGSLMFHVSYQVVSVGWLLVVFLLAMVALYGMGMMTSSLFLMWGREAWHIANLAQEPVYLASGFFFPVKNLGFWVAAAASIIPLTLALDAMRQLSYPLGETTAFIPWQKEIAILILLGVVFVTGAKLLLDKLEALAVQEGRLTESRR